MTQADTERTLTEFFEQFPTISGMLQAILADEPLLVMEFRPSGTTLALDFSADPVRVTVNPAGTRGTVTMSATADVMRDLMLGTQAAAELLGDRQLMLRGGMYGMTKMLPLLQLSPPLFCDHLVTRVENDEEGEGGVRRKLTARGRRFAASVTERPWCAMAFIAGLGLGRLERSELQRALAAMARGMERTSPLLVEKKPPVRHTSAPHALDPPPVSRRRTTLLRMVDRSMFAVGVAAGVTRYKARIPIRPMRILGRMSDGIVRARETA